MKAEGKTNLIIRADGNARIGAGHLMRCLTIADEIRDRDSVCFWCADAESAALAQSRGYSVRVLGTDYRDMPSELPEWEKSSARQDRGAAGRRILVDSYYVNAEYLQALRSYGRVYLMDDMMQQTWPVDGIINYNAFAQRKNYELLYAGRREKAQALMPELYIGPSYIPVRPRFAGRDYQVQKQVQEILITTGGGDQENIAGQILERIEDMGCRIHVVSGPYNPHGDWLSAYAVSHPQVVLHRQVAEMAELMLQCDLAVTAGGTTVYELCALGVPFICFSYAENQEALAEYAGKKGIGWDAGSYHRDPAGTLERIGRLAQQAGTDYNGRQRMSQCARALVDGSGARRLAEVLGQRHQRNGKTGVDTV